MIVARLPTLVGSLELLEEAYVILGEETQVAYSIFEVGDTLYTHSECIAAVLLAVDTAVLQYVGVDHTTAKDLDPSRMLTEVTSLTSADVAGDIHLCRWLGEGEVGRTEADLSVRTEHLLCEVKEHLLEVGKRYLLVDVQGFYLMEEAVCTIGDGFIAINATGTDDADGRLCLQHRARLYGGGVSAK